MITHIRVKNFKSWQDSGEVKLAPLTGFFGTNSSGKSSLLQMLLLLKQNVGTKGTLFLGNENSLVNLGRVSEVIHGHEQEGSFELGFGFKIEKPLTFNALLPDKSGVLRHTSFTTDSFGFDLTILSKGDKAVVDNIHYRLKSGNEESVVSVGNNLKDWLNEPLQGVSEDSPITQLSSGFISSEFNKLFSRISYLCPTRVHPQRLYRWERTHPKEIDMWGNKAVDVLLSARVRQLTTAHNGENTSIEERISTWLQKMDLAYSFQLVPSGNLDDNNYEVRFQKSPSSVEVTLADMGHGVADLFPLLVHCCYVPEGSTLILEQPGVHLHPKAQADLADLLIEVITERNLQILVESHSEHLLTRLQLRIAEEKISENDTAIYFCENKNGVSNIKPLEIDDLGNIKNWPKNFFGDVRGDLVKMTREQMKRQEKVEG